MTLRFCAFSAVEHISSAFSRVSSESASNFSHIWSLFIPPTVLSLSIERVALITKIRVSAQNLIIGKKIVKSFSIFLFPVTEGVFFHGFFNDVPCECL